MDNIKRLQQLSGIEVADEVMSDDDVSDLEDREFDRKRNLEKIVSKIIFETFKKIGFDIHEAEYGGYEDARFAYDVSFDADTGEGSVFTENCTSEQVAVLQTSGLADNFSLRSSQGGIRFEFEVNTNLLNSLMRQSQ